MGSFAKVGWRMWHTANELGGSGKRMWLASCHPPHKGLCLPPQDVLQAYWDKFGAFNFSMDAARKKSILAAWEASTKRGGNCEFMNGLWLA